MKLPILFTIPHASYRIPREIKAKMLISRDEILRECDLYTKDVYGVKNAYTVSAKYSRLVVDLNRSKKKSFPNQFRGGGMCASLINKKTKVYKKPLSKSEIDQRIKKYYDPFHKRVKDLMPKVKFILDCHSLWSHAPITTRTPGRKRKDIVLSNRNGGTCSPELTNKIKEFFIERGFSVAINDPFLGAYIIQKYGARPAKPGLAPHPSLQIEINRALYMNEHTLAPYKPKIAKLNQLMSELAQYIDTLL